MKLTAFIKHPVVILLILIMSVYWQFFLFGRIPMPGDTLIGAYFPWLDYKWGFPVGVPVKNALISDVFSQFFVWKYALVGMIKDGHLPLWNPYSFSGTPFLGTFHSSVLLPFNLLLLLPKFWGWGFYIFAQTVLAALGIYFYTSLFIKSSYAKLCAGLVFAFSALMTTWVEFGTGVYAAAFLAWGLFFIHKFTITNKFRYLFAFSFSQLSLIFSGHAQITIYSLVLLPLYIFYFGKNLRNKLIVLFFILIAVLLASVQLLPAYDLTKYSVRSDEAYSKSFNFGLNPPYELVRFFAADFFGNPATYNHWDTISYHEQTSYLGAITLPLVVSLLFIKKRRREENFWLGIFLVSIFLALDTPLTRFIYSQPLPFLTYSSASRIFFMTSLAAGVLVAFSIQRLKDSDDFRNLTGRSALYLGAVIIGIICGITFVRFLLITSGSQLENSVVLANHLVTLKNLVLPIGFVAMLFIASFKFVPKQLTLVIILVVLFFDLSRYFQKYNPFIDQKLVFPKTPIIEFLQSQPGYFRIARADYEIMPPNTWTFYGLSSVEGYDPLAQENYARLFNIINGGSYSGDISRYVELKIYPSKFLDALNTKYFVGIKRNDKGEVGGDKLNYRVDEAGYQVVFEDKNSVVLENKSAANRAYFVSSVISANDKDQVYKLIEDPNFNPVTQAVVQEGHSKDNLSSGDVEIKYLSPNKIDIKTNNSSEGFLVVADTYSKDWKVTENGQNIPLYEANSALKGFYTSPGQNHYQLNFFPNSLKLGIMISSLSGFVILTLVYITFRKKLF